MSLLLRLMCQTFLVKCLNLRSLKFCTLFNENIHTTIYFLIDWQKKRSYFWIFFSVWHGTHRVVRYTIEIMKNRIKFVKLTRSIHFKWIICAPSSNTPYVCLIYTTIHMYLSVGNSIWKNTVSSFIRYPSCRVFFYHSLHISTKGRNNFLKQLIR